MACLSASVPDWLQLTSHQSDIKEVKRRTNGNGPARHMTAKHRDNGLCSDDNGSAFLQITAFTL
jgi:hypothetical protein